MSRLIRYALEAPAVFIGEKQHDALAEAKAEQRLGQLFPQVSLVTTPEGAKLIPITEVRKLEEKLRADCEQARRQGYESGHQAGLEKGLEEARKVLRQFEKAIEDAVGRRAELLDEARQKILELVVKISRKVTFDGLQIDQEATLAMIEGVINQLVDRSRLCIKVHPDHLPLMEQSMNRFLSGSTSIKDLRFEADPRVRVGGCFIETPTGDIDARLTSQFDVIENILCGSAEGA
ncbi:MAG: FliH/SctL family protein [Candidatus Zixiibacteriota bacterium]